MTGMSINRFATYRAEACSSITWHRTSMEISTSSPYQSDYIGEIGSSFPRFLQAFASWGSASQLRSMKVVICAFMDIQMKRVCKAVNDWQQADPCLTFPLAQLMLPRCIPLHWKLFLSLFISRCLLSSLSSARQPVRLVLGISIRLANSKSPPLILKFCN